MIRMSSSGTDEKDGMNRMWVIAFGKCSRLAAAGFVVLVDSGASAALQLDNPCKELYVFNTYKI